ncbi:hypothetical protein LOTGIDRAFT_118291, partial [Lottia gigantea]
KEKVGGLAYEVILKPATATEVPVKPISPPKEKAISEADILNKLKKAEERRQSLEQQRLEQLAKDRAKAQEIVAKAQEESKLFSEETEKKLRKAMEANKENRETQINALQERLREHERRIEEVRRNKQNNIQQEVAPEGQA